MVATRLKDHLERLGHSCSVINVSSTIFRPDLMQMRGFSVPFVLTNPVLNFIDIRRCNLERYDVVVPLHPHTLYLNHPNMLVYFLHHYRVEYDLAEWYLAGARGKPSRRFLRTFNIYNRRFIDRLALIRTKNFPFIAISKTVAYRLAKFWNVNAKPVIYPGGYDPSFYDQSRDYVLYFGRLDWNLKRLKLVYEVCETPP